MYQIVHWPLKGLWNSDTLNISMFIDSAYRPYNNVSNTVPQRDLQQRVIAA